MNRSFSDYDFMSILDSDDNSLLPLLERMREGYRSYISLTTQGIERKLTEE